MTVKSFYLALLLILVVPALAFSSCVPPQNSESSVMDLPAKRPVDNRTTFQQQPAAAAPVENASVMSGLTCANVGCLAPDFSIPTIDQRELTLSSLRGKKVILAFLSTSCSACLKTMLCLLPIYDSWPRDQLEMVFVMSGEPFDDIQRWVSVYGIKCVVALDSRVTVLDQYKPEHYPALYFLTADGHIKVRKLAPIDDCTEQLDALLRQY
jgi:peroxiredoxin